ALARLPDDQREALVLGVLEGMSYQELADMSGCAVGTAKSRVFRARRQLEVWLTGEESVSDASGSKQSGRVPAKAAKNAGRVRTGTARMSVAVI
ncbi:MAG: sigma factor-like helix-turn-helix DNA-binding protein, partial [Acetobacter sp.]